MNTESREVNSIRNFIVGVISQVFFLFLNLVAKTVFIKILGTEFLGINGLFTNIFLLLSFAEFGIGSVMVYSLYEPITKHDTNKITSIYQYFKKIYMIMSIIITIIGVGIIPMLKFIVNTQEEVPFLALYYILFLISLVISNMYIYKSHLIIADQKKYIIWLYEFIFDGLALILQIIFLLLTGDYILYLIIVLVKKIIFNFSVARKVKRLYPFVDSKETYKKISIKEKKKILNKINDVFVYKLARALLTGTDNILISILVGTVWVGYYSNYDLIIVGVLSLVTTFYSAISASVGNLIVKENIENQFKIFNITMVINFWITGFTTTCLYVLFQDFITLWIGSEYLLHWNIVIVIVFNYYLVCTRNSIKIFREAAGMFEKVKHVMSIAALINIILSILMGKTFGVIGILLATSITTLSTYYWYEAKLLMESKFGCSVKVYFKSQIEGLFLTIISAFITSICVSMINEVTIGTLIIKGCICLVIPNIFYFIVLKRKEEIQMVFTMISRNYKNFINR
ncbi:oligosaccharide flippase family protein [Clostridium sediminicola]|uniref:lipopolysaccharide biosynthesis protein n=1 Tax=Clostridium sediminicola TaxID=3114879 RepID=UPI0031F215FB